MLDARREVDGPVHVNIAESLIVAIREGMGIGMVPLYAAISGLRDGTLVRVLPEYTLQKTTVYALYPSRKFIDAKTRTWVEFLRSHLPKVIARDEALLAEVGQLGGGDDPVQLVGVAPATQDTRTPLDR
ncbi:DNA-binding transcriptional LysR family regulator [Paraburkholderia sp. MM5482-R2]